MINETIFRRDLRGNLIVENARIIFETNFSGKVKQYNAAGDRNFCIEIPDEDIARELAEEGWNVKVYRPKSEDRDPINYLQITVRFDILPPNIYMVTSRKKTTLNEETVKNLDGSYFVKIDLVIRPRRWDGGIKAYLNTGYFTIEEDPFADKYDDEYEVEY